MPPLSFQLVTTLMLNKAHSGGAGFMTQLNKKLSKLPNWCFEPV